MNSDAEQEWNGRYRDTIRDYWRGRLPRLGELGYRLCGSSDLYADDGRSPFASVNYVTAHDGFTVADLVSHDRKHNHANGEDNRDGTDDNRSSNGGVEGPTDDPAVLAVRDRRARNLLATLLLSHGVAMLLGGDELGRTQRGNNNAYCQDNEIAWYDWDHADLDLLAFVRSLAQLRATHPVLRRRGWFTGRPLCGDDVDDIVWLDRHGQRLTTTAWDTGPTDFLAVFLNGALIGPCDRAGERIVDHDLLLLLNTADDPAPFTAPPAPFASFWQLPGSRPPRRRTTGRHAPGGRVGEASGRDRALGSQRHALVDARWHHVRAHAPAGSGLGRVGPARRTRARRRDHRRHRRGLRRLPVDGPPDSPPRRP